MKTQQNQIAELLTAEGWAIREREAAPEWWLDEVWHLESLWSPVDAKAYVSFLVDGGATSERKAGQQVWAVYIGRDIATSWSLPGAVPLRPNWESVRVTKVANLIKALRAGS
jgi:hypothetical protein